MRKILFPLAVFAIILTMSNCDNENNPSVYRITYNGNGNTEGEIPSDTKSYSTGDTFQPKWNLDIKRNGRQFWAWEVSNAASVENPVADFKNGVYLVNASSKIKFGDNDIVLKAVFTDDEFEDMEDFFVVEPPKKIYKVIYNGNGNTEGEVPVDDNLYATGDTFYPKWSLDLVRNGFKFSNWKVSTAASVKNPYIDYLDGTTYIVRGSSIIEFGENDIELIAWYANDSL
jgi:hypothetical protein